MKDEEKIYGEDGRGQTFLLRRNPERKKKREDRPRRKKRSLLWNWSVSLRKIKVSAPS